MCKKIIVSFLFVLGSVSSYAQNRKIVWQGTDSIEITIWKEAKSKYKIIQHRDTTALPDTDSLKKFLDSLKLTAGQRKDLLDSINKLETKKDTLFVSIQKPVTIPDAPSEATSGTDKNDKPNDNNNTGFPFIMVILFILAGVFIGLGIPYFTEWILRIIRWMRRNKQITQPPTSDNAEGGGTGTQTSTPLTLYILPSLLAEKISNKINLKKPDEGAKYIINEFDRLKGELDKKDKEFESKKKEAEGLTTQLEQGEKKITDLTAEIEKLKLKLVDQASFYKEFNDLAESAVNRYYTELVISLEKNKNMEKEEKEKQILQNIFTFAALSASLLKKQIRDAGPLDQMNIDLLKGEQPEPEGTITENSPSNSDALAYYTFHLLKGHGIEKLDNVLIHGYKIGK